MTLNESIYNDLKNKFCKDSKECNNFEHLSDIDFQLNFIFKDINNINIVFDL